MTEQNIGKSKAKPTKEGYLRRGILSPFRWLWNLVDMDGFTDWTKGYDVPFQWRWAIWGGILILATSGLAIKAAILSNHWAILFQLVIWPLIAIYQVYRGRERAAQLREFAEIWRAQAGDAGQIAEEAMTLIEAAQKKLNESVVYTQLLGSALEKSILINEEILAERHRILSWLEYATEGISDVAKELLSFEGDGRMSDLQPPPIPINDRGEEDKLRAICMIELGVQKMESLQAEMAELKDKVTKWKNAESSQLDEAREMLQSLRSDRASFSNPMYITIPSPK